ncbi:hypothetical protein C8A01DRAFT_18976 [Parachaetomium inaequale]|uniref:Uncharacterized protein n=1 Tax=Parachaetomium inaequale TaxID=2588326 RepID=A0AAN6P9G5_9PEZI|nr:hypothetical protein C8A01DRAFT_18976 [Parachaetomium inaequale]
MSYQGNSNVGFPSLYESQNQRSHTQGEVDELTQHTGENVKGFLPKGQGGEVNRLQAEELHRKQVENMKKDPTLAATLHGNKPAKGAVIDKELQEEDEAMLRKKGDSMPGKKH